MRVCVCVCVCVCVFVALLILLLAFLLTISPLQIIIDNNDIVLKVPPKAENAMEASFSFLKFPLLLLFSDHHLELIQEKKLQFTEFVLKCSRTTRMMHWKLFSNGFTLMAIKATLTGMIYIYTYIYKYIYTHTHTLSLSLFLFLSLLTIQRFFVCATP